MGFRNFYIKTIWRYCAHFSKKSPTPWIFWIHSVFSDQWKHTFSHFQNQQTSRLNLKNCLFFNIFQAESCFEVVSWLNTSYENLRIYSILNMLGVMLVTLEGKYSSVLRSLLLFSFIFRNIASFSQLRSLDSRRLVHQSAKY